MKPSVVVAENLLKYNPISIESLIGEKSKPTKKMEEVDLNDLKNYAAEDADLTFQLYLEFKDKIKDLNLDFLLMIQVWINSIYLSSLQDF